MNGITTSLSFTYIDHNNKEKSFNCKIDNVFTESQLEATGATMGLPPSHMILQVTDKSWESLRQQISVKLLEVFNKDC